MKPGRHKPCAYSFMRSAQQLQSLHTSNAYTIDALFGAPMLHSRSNRATVVLLRARHLRARPRFAMSLRHTWDNVYH